MSDNRRWTGLTPDSFSNEIGGALKVMGHENEIQVSKKNSERNMASFVAYNLNKYSL